MEVKQEEVKDIKANSKKEQIDKNIENNSVPYIQLLKYSTATDRLLMLIGSIAAIITGSLLPLSCIVLGELIDSYSPDSDIDDIVDGSLRITILVCYMGIVSLFTAFFQIFGWVSSGEKQSIRMRKEYFKAVLTQDIAWFDQNDPNKISEQISTDIQNYGLAIGEKAPTFLMQLTTFFGGFLVALLYGWELALIGMVLVPLIVIAAYSFTYVLQNAEKQISSGYEEANSRAQQVISGIKTVKSLNGQEHELSKYHNLLIIAKKQAIKWGLFIGITFGSIQTAQYLDYPVVYWAGAQFLKNDYQNVIADRPYTAGDVVIVFLAILNSAFAFGQCTPCLRNFIMGKQAAYRIYKIIDSKPKINQKIEQGTIIHEIKDNIILKDVQFAYPTKNNKTVLKNINLQIEIGKKTALVGKSGCGKSTIMQLVERFYDCDSGSIFINGINIQDLNLSHYRQLIGYVGQEPVLFDGTIRENILFGKQNATESEMIEALKQANAWEFVKNLEKQLDCQIGANGSQLSGGQKQRICIARAIIKNPCLLLLDEATSALDRKNEIIIQNTLDQISQSRTTLVIAHRLSTIQNADKIIVIDEGNVVETGNHNELIEKNGFYAQLCQNQLKIEKKKEILNMKETDSQEELYVKNDQLNVKDGSEIKQNQQENHGGQDEHPIKYPKNQLQDKQKGQELNDFEAQKNVDITKKVEKKIENKQKKVNLKRIFSMNQGQKCNYLIGGISSVIAGSNYNLCAIFSVKLLETLSYYGNYSESKFNNNITFYCLAFVFLGIITQIFTSVAFYIWKKIGEDLTFILRQQLYRKILNMKVSWFDQNENSVGSITQQLGTDTSAVNALTSNIFNVYSSNLGTIGTGILIGMIYDWRTTLACLVCFPIQFLSGIVYIRVQQGLSEISNLGLRESSNIVQETVLNIRTVFSFSNQHAVLESYNSKFAQNNKIINKQSLQNAIIYGISMLVFFVTRAYQFYIGVVFVKAYNLDQFDNLIAIFAIMNASVSASTNNSFMGDLGKAYAAAANIFKILDSKDEIQEQNDEIKEKNDQNQNNNKIENKLISDFSNFKGNISFKNVVFKYPNRDSYVLKGISFDIQQGKKYGFVGTSGCGKSTIFQIILRYYDIESGQILIDGIDHKLYELGGLRKQFGVVTQEPILFTGTIQDNIQYNQQNVSFEQIKKAAVLSNAQQFIENSQFEKDNKSIVQGEGYDREVGSKGNFLSGGQKQRICIARAIIQNPKILLLDEATSALDSKNEELVQESLDKIMSGKTTISVAHRLSTIQNSDKIFVFDNGKIVEEGIYNTLVDKKGYFYKLQQGLEQ